MMLRRLRSWQIWGADASAHKGVAGKDKEMANAVFETVRGKKAKGKSW